MLIAVVLLIATFQTLTPPEAAATAEIARAQATAVSRFATASAPTRTAIPTMTPTSTQTPTPEPTATATQTPEPTLTATGTMTPTIAPSETPGPTSVPTLAPATPTATSEPMQAAGALSLPPALQCVGLAAFLIVAILLCYRLLLPTVRRR